MKSLTEGAAPREAFPPDRFGKQRHPRPLVCGAKTQEQAEQALKVRLRFERDDPRIEAKETERPVTGMGADIETEIVLAQKPAVEPVHAPTRAAPAVVHEERAQDPAKAEKDRPRMRCHS